MHELDFLSLLTKKIFDNLPTDCLVCKSFSKNDLDLCATCYANIAQNNFCCDICAEPFRVEQNHQAICGACLKKPPKFTKLYAPFLYEPPLEDILWQFKFKADKLAGNLLLKLILEKLPKSPLSPALIVSMPKNTNHDYAKNFDSVYWLAKKLAKYWQLDYLPCQYITRKPDVPAQRGLTLKQRQTNTRRAWDFSENIAELIVRQNLILLDDVATTGASLSALAQQLSKFKPKSITAISLFRTPK